MFAWREKERGTSGHLSFGGPGKKQHYVAAKRTTGKDWKFLRLNHDSRHWKVDRVLANHSLGSTASQGTSNIPFPWFLLSQCNRQARNQERSTIMCLAEEHFSYQQLLNHIFLLSSKRSCEKCSTFTTSWSYPWIIIFELR